MKKVLAVLLAAMLALSLAACNTDNLEEYKEAVKKTEQVEKGQFSAEFSMNMDYNTDGMTAEEIKRLSYFRDMKGNFNAVYDGEVKKAALHNYMSLGGLGFDFDMYVNGEEMFMKLPVIGKFIRVNEIYNQADIDTGKEPHVQAVISDESKKAIADKWIGLMKNDDVFKSRNIILTTPDGEVKTSEYTITLSDEQIRNLVKECMEIAAKDEALKEFYNNYVIIKLDEEKITFEKMLESMSNNIGNYSIENFKYTALVDIDGYIVNENIIFAIKALKPDLVLKGMDWNFNVKTWDINKKQEFDFPVLTEENTIHADNMEEMPDLMKDIFENKK